MSCTTKVIIIHNTKNITNQAPVDMLRQY